jgi:hypothetical protein
MHDWTILDLTFFLAQNVVFDACTEPEKDNLIKESLVERKSLVEKKNQ